MTVTPRSSNPGNIEAVQIVSNKEPRKDVSLLGGLISFIYYESIVSDTVRATVTFADTGVIEGEATTT